MTLVTSLIACAIRVISLMPSPSRTTLPFFSCRPGDHAEQVRVARALAVAVRGALHVGDARLDGDQGVRDAAAGVVVAVDAECAPRSRTRPRGRCRRARSASCRRWCRTARSRRRPPRRRRGRTRARTRGWPCSRRRSARRRGRPAGPLPVRWRTVSAIIARFSSSVVRSASSTCRSWLLATRVTTGARDSRRAATCGSSAAATPALRVEPNAASVACRRSSSVCARRKNSVSFGIAPGQPPSMNPTPSRSRCRAITSLSATVRFRPSCCAPSRRVVS